MAGIPLRILIPFLAVASLNLLPCAARAEAPPLAPGGQDAEKKTPAVSAVKGVHRERTRNQIKRLLLLRSLDDLQVERKFALEDIRELELRIDAITPLESPRRKEDFQALIDWYNSYLDRLGDREEEFERGLAALAAVAGADGEMWGKSLEAIALEEKERTRELDDEAKSTGNEEKRLAGVYNRKRELQGRLVDLDNRIALIGRRLNDKQRSLSDKQNDLHEADLLRTESGLAQAEFNNLPAVDEDVLSHYAEMGARKRLASDQLALKAEEYEALRSLIAALNNDGPGYYGTIAKAYRRVIESYESGIGRLGKMVAKLDLALSRISPAETVRQTSQSSGLAAFNQRLRERFVGRINQLKALKGAYEADLGEFRSERP